jgi:hypothetical protein
LPAVNAENILPVKGKTSFNDKVLPLQAVVYYILTSAGNAIARLRL